MILWWSLAGSILSHPYYVLQRERAQVECIDLFGADEDVDEYNKIVGGAIPNFIKKRGETTQTAQLVDGALVTALQQKLVEEAFEALDAKSGPDLISELADVQEVLRALCRELSGASPSDIEAQKAKRKRDVAVVSEKGLMLIKTASPHSIHKQPPTREILLLLEITQESSELVISDASSLPARPIYRRSDLRQVNQQLRKLFQVWNGIKQEQRECPKSGILDAIG